MNTETSEIRLPRRTVLQWFATMAATGEIAIGQEAVVSTKGYGTDPKLNTTYSPGDTWPLTLTDQQKAITNALADIVIPADDLGPAASAVRVGDFIDEWVSAPYPRQKSDREVVTKGLDWLAQKSFTKLSALEQTQLCDELCQPEPPNPEMKKAANFFHKFTTLCLGAYYNTRDGWKAIGYVGNQPSMTFEGPPQEVLDLLDLEQTVKL